LFFFLLPTFQNQNTGRIKRKIFLFGFDLNKI